MVKIMALAKLVLLKFMALLCLSLCFAHRVTMDPENAEKPNIGPSHVETLKIASRSSVSSSRNNSGNGDEIPAGDCAGGLGFNENGPGSCCCEYCGAGDGPGKLHSEHHLDPSQDSCCQIDKLASDSLDEDAAWGCCNCPEGIMIISWRRAMKMHVQGLSPYGPTQIDWDM